MTRYPIRRTFALSSAFAAPSAKIGPLWFCAAGGGLIVGTPCTSSADENGLCFTPTGKAPCCAVNGVQDAGRVASKKDEGCQRFWGADAACIQRPACAEQFGVATVCAGPDACIFQRPGTEPAFNRATPVFDLG